MRRAFSILLILAIAAVVVLISGSGNVRAYPTGWTSDNAVPGVSATSGTVDMAVSGNYVHLVYRPNSTSVYYVRSADGGLTWSAPARIDQADASENGCPQVEVANQGVIVTYSSFDQGTYYMILSRRSLDNGATWQPGYYSESTGIMHNCYAPCLTTTPGGQAYVIWQEDSLYHAGWYGVRFSIMTNPLNPVTVNTDTVNVHAINPSMTCASETDFYMAYEEWDGAWPPAYDQIHLRRYISGTGWSNIPGTATTDYPVTSYGGFGRTMYPSLASNAGGIYVLYEIWSSGGTFSAGQQLFTTSPQGNLTLAETSPYEPYPKACERSAHRVYQGSDGCIYSHEGAGKVMGHDPVGSGGMAICYDGGKHYLAGQFGSQVLFKRTDTVPPNGTIQANNVPSQADPIYVNKDFPLTFNDVIDDWNLTGTTYGPTVACTRGVTQIEVKYSRDKVTWSTLKKDDNVYPAILTAPDPWNVNVHVNNLGDGTYYFKGIITDTAGNTRDTGSSGPIVIDGVGPVTVLNSDATPNKNDWCNKPVTASIRTSDNNLQNTMYQIEDLKGGSGKGNWATYQTPFTLKDGRWRVNYYSSDRAGNAEAVQSTEFQIDTVPPTVGLEKPTKDYIQTGFSSKDEAELEGSAVDENQLFGIGIYVAGQRMDTDTRVVKVNPRNWGTVGTWNVSSVARNKGKVFPIEVRAVDIAGNECSGGKRVNVDNFCKDMYFAEGNTLPEFEEWLCMQNPGDKDATVRVEFMLEDGQVIAKDIILGKHSRTTKNVKEYVPEGHIGVSTHIHSDSQAIIAERPMYFNYKKADPNYNWKGGHIAVGQNTLQKAYYFAEGTTRKNATDGIFDEWITLQNPNAATATARLTYMLGSGSNINKSYQVGPHSRLTIEVSKDVGYNQDVSTKIESDLPIAAERPQYFDYHRWSLEGHNVVGASSPSKEWNFAEGTTNPGFEEWITVQNPNNAPARVTATYMNGAGKVVVANKKFGPRSRGTISVADDAGDNQNISASLKSDVPVVVERPMYFDYKSKWTGGSNAMGANSASTKFYIAEGTTRTDFETWYTMCNPGGKTVVAAVTFMFGNGKTNKKSYSVMPHSRLTLNVNQEAGAGQDVSAKINANGPILVERPMYFNYEGTRTGGHVSQAYGVD